MKVKLKKLIARGAITLSILLFGSITAYFIAFDPPKMAMDRAKDLVFSFQKLDRKSFETHWSKSHGPVPTNQEIREEIISWGEKQGEFINIEEIKELDIRKHISFTGKGITHIYKYQILCKFTKGDVIFIVSVKGNRGGFEVLNLTMGNPI
ncbi:hypothetical protein ACJJIF_16610 [Microbulbifer sp. SSSA002]|uniref:hypothetical protein n=1 Tax=unclassified Microbulbifer TaxID=2619833 RepID=UPI00403A77A0